LTGIVIHRTDQMADSTTPSNKQWCSGCRGATQRLKRRQAQNAALRHQERVASSNTPQLNALTLPNGYQKDKHSQRKQHKTQVVSI